MIYCIDNSALDEYTVTAHPRHRVFCILGWAAPEDLEFREGSLSNIQINEVVAIIEEHYPMEDW